MKRPVLTIAVLSLITILLLQSAMTFEQNMTRDIEVYLPEGEESTNILIEVREDWATDLIIVYVETPNAVDKDFYNEENISRDYEFTQEDISVIKEVQEDLPLVPRPFEEIGKKIHMAPEDVIN